MRIRTTLFAAVLGLCSSAAAQGTRLLRQPTVSATQVAFAYAGDIWIAARDGGDARRLTSFPGVESDPQLSPDGKWVAFTGSYGDNQDVYVIEAAGGRIRPLQVHGVKLMSIGFLVERDAPAIWRGPIIMKVIQQFLRDVDWGELDYFLVDMPPGTGDAQLSLVQSVAVSGAVIVTTPQDMSVGDALKGAKMFERVSVPVLGVVENMSPFIDPLTGSKVAYFDEGGGQRLADEVGVPLLGSIPLQLGLAQKADAGEPIVVAEPASPAATELLALAERLHLIAAAKGMSLPVINQ